VAIESPLPAVKGLTANSKVSTSSRRIATRKEVEQHPLQPLLGRFTYPLPEARQLASLGNFIPPNLVHPDTLPSVTNHSERAQSLRSVQFSVE
jgi:hypothetical protein